MQQNKLEFSSRNCPRHNRNKKVKTLKGSKGFLGIQKSVKLYKHFTSSIAFANGKSAPRKRPISVEETPAPISTVKRQKFIHSVTLTTEAYPEFMYCTVIWTVGYFVL